MAVRIIRDKKLTMLSKKEGSVLRLYTRPSIAFDRYLCPDAEVPNTRTSCAAAPRRNVVHVLDGR